MTDHPDWNFAVLAVVRVVDGDTVDLRVDLGFHVNANLRFRLARINAPEMGTPEGAVAKAWATTWLTAQLASDLRVISHKTDDYGRWVGDVVRADGHSLSDDMLLANQAVPWPAPKPVAANLAAEVEMANDPRFRG